MGSPLFGSGGYNNSNVVASGDMDEGGCQTDSEIPNEIGPGVVIAFRKPREQLWVKKEPSSIADLISWCDYFEMHHSYLSWGISMEARRGNRGLIS